MEKKKAHIPTIANSFYTISGNGTTSSCDLMRTFLNVEETKGFVVIEEWNQSAQVLWYTSRASIGVGGKWKQSGGWFV